MQLIMLSHSRISPKVQSELALITTQLVKEIFARYYVRRPFLVP